MNPEYTPEYFIKKFEAIPEDNRVLAQALRAAQQEVAELRKDKERMDKLQAIVTPGCYTELGHFNSASSCRDPAKYTAQRPYYLGALDETYGEDLRQAIDLYGAAGEGNRPSKCPQCGDPVIQPSSGDNYCESCGWPDENREDDLADRVTDAVLAVVCTEGHDPEEREQIKNAVESVLAGEGRGQREQAIQTH